MGYSQLKKLRKEDTTSFDRSYVRTVIEVRDVFDLVVYQQLHQTLGEDIKMISSVPVTRDSLLTTGPVSMRGEKTLEVLRASFPEYEFTLRDFPALFYKDGDWKDFNGRAKSEKLLASEEYFTGKAIDFDIFKAFPFLNDDSFWTSLEGVRLPERITNVREQTPTDLISPVNWAIECGSGKVIECENFIFGGSPQAFLDLIQDKKALSDSFMEFCESTRSSAELVVKFEFHSPLHQGGETFFIPLSYTHDWGHFVGEFKGNEAQFVHFFETSETSEEEVSRKLKLLKKGMEKIFPEFLQKHKAEFLVLRPESGCLNIDDSSYQKIERAPDHLHFIHRNAPLVSFNGNISSVGDSDLPLRFDARALASAQLVLQKMSKKE